jgi:hypothetical protein
VFEWVIFSTKLLPTQNIELQDNWGHLINTTSQAFIKLLVQ